MDQPAEPDVNSSRRYFWGIVFFATLLAAGIVGWRLNFNYCMQQAELHDSKMQTPLMRSFAGYHEKPYVDKDKRHRELKNAYRQAAWFPWQRLWIHEESNP